MFCIMIISDKKIGVGSSWGSYGIEVTVWYK